MRVGVSKCIGKRVRNGPWQSNSPGRVDRRGAVTCCFLSQHRVRPKGFEPLTF